jgi:hypothetical protein
VENILSVQKTRGRGSNTLKVLTRDGKSISVPMDEKNRYYRKILEWVKEGNVISEPPPKSIDPNRGKLAYTDHPVFVLPGNESLSAWRYMDLWKFISLLENKALYFIRGIYLRELDSYEGTLPKPNQSFTPEELFEKMFGRPLDIKMFSRNFTPERFLESYMTYREGIQVSALVNCWSLNQYESMGMWNGFASGEQSIAIRSSVSKLKKCFGKYIDYNVYVGQVSYIDYELEEIGPSNYMKPLMHKTKYYESEKEVRCIINDDDDISFIPEDEPSTFFYEQEGVVYSRGFNVDVDLDILIEQIYISPKAPKGFQSAVRYILDNYGMEDIEIIPSAINNTVG